MCNGCVASFASAVCAIPTSSGRAAPTLVIELLYGSGMRLVEALQLRIKDVDFGANEITVRGGKGDRDRKSVV